MLDVAVDGSGDEVCEHCGKQEPEASFEHDAPPGWCDECASYARSGSRAYQEFDKQKSRGY